MNFFIQSKDTLPCLAHTPSISPSMLPFALVLGESIVRFLCLSISSPLFFHLESVIILAPIPLSGSAEILKLATLKEGSSILSSAFMIIIALFGEGPTLFKEIGIICLSLKLSFR